MPGAHSESATHNISTVMIFFISMSPSDIQMRRAAVHSLPMALQASVFDGRSHMFDVERADGDVLAHALEHAFHFVAGLRQYRLP